MTIIRLKSVERKMKIEIRRAQKYAHVIFVLFSQIFRPVILKYLSTVNYCSGSNNAKHFIRQDSTAT